MKRILALLCALLIMFSVCACSRKSDLEKFLSKNAEEMESELSAVFGQNAQVTSKIEDNSFVFEVTAYDFDYLIDSQKEVLNKRLKEIIPSEEFINTAKETNKKLKELENYTVIVKNSKGEVITKVSSISEPAEEATDK